MVKQDKKSKMEWWFEDTPYAFFLTSAIGLFLAYFSFFIIFIMLIMSLFDYMRKRINKKKK